MKELSIEEKAQRYDKVVERAKIEKKSRNLELLEFVDENFPELKESEDEKIRKWLIGLIKSNEYGSISKVGEMPCSKINVLAWLEKQGEQGNNEDEAILHRFSFYSYKDEPNILYLAGLYVNDEYRNKGIGTKILKIADEVAVSMKCSSILLKTEIGSDAERLYKNNGYSIFRNEENQVWLEKQVKSMEIIEQNNTDEYIETKGLFEIEAEAEELTKQKFDWSKEDEEIFNLALDMVEWYSGEDEEKSRTVSEWLKSIKERVQPKQEWSEKDKETLDGVIDSLRRYNYNVPSRAVDEQILWLKSLKDRYTWKPSEEQLRELENVFSPDTDSWDEDILRELYKQLKQL